MGASQLGFSFCMSVMDVVIPAYFCRQLHALLMAIVLKGEGETCSVMSPLFPINMENMPHEALLAKRYDYDTNVKNVI